MPDQAIVFRAEFCARGYTKEDLADLRATLEDIASVRLRGDYRPEAGSSAEMAAFLEFIGVVLAKDAVGWVGKEAIARTTKGLSEWWTRKAQRGPIEPEVQVFRASFDDIDIDFQAHRYGEGPDAYLLNADAVAAIPAALLVVEGHFSPATLMEHQQTCTTPRLARSSNCRRRRTIQPPASCALPPYENGSHTCRDPDLVRGTNTPTNSSRRPFVSVISPACRS